MTTWDIFHIESLAAFAFSCAAMSLDIHDLKNIYEQDATEVVTRKKHHLKMTEMQLCGNGVFSNVYKGTLLSREGNKTVAVKKTFPEIKEHSFERKFLSLENRKPHKNVIHMLYYFANQLPGGTVCEAFVFDYMPETLHSVIRHSELHMTDIKLYTWQLFNGLNYCSHLEVIHRDLKPLNILVDHTSGILKISDFGSAKIVRNDEVAASYQVTRFYRPPELLMGSKHYSWRIDVWSGGCCFGEMLKKRTLLPGRDSKHQMELIIRVLGPPTDSDQLAMRVRARFEGEHHGATGIAKLLPNIGSDSIQLLSRILVYKPKERLCGLQLLKDPYFNELFSPGAKRPNGRFVSDVIDKTDLIVAEMEELGRQEKQKDKKPEKSAELRKRITNTGVPVIKIEKSSILEESTDNHVARAPKRTVQPRSKMSHGQVMKKTSENGSAMQMAVQPRTKKSYNVQSKYLMPSK